MIIVFRPDATQEDLDHVVKKLRDLGLQAHISRGTERTIIGVIGDTSKVTEEEEDSIRAASVSVFGRQERLDSFTG